MRESFASLKHAAVVALAIGCGNDGPSGSSGGFEDEPNSEAIVETFAEEVVVSTYELLHTRIGTLSESVDALAADPSEAQLTSAQGAWISARQPWELSEAHLFGPVDSEGFDPALDSWPVNRTDLDAVLASEDALTDEYVRNLDPTVQGFHTAEYLLFGVERSRKAAELGDRELAYLAAVTHGMEAVSRELEARWKEGTEDALPYAEVLRTAGEQGNRVYPSKTAAAQEILFGIIGILDEVANGKIADPFDEQDVRLVESQFSFNSLTDFTNNIQGAENAYLGRNPKTHASGSSFSEFVAGRDSDLDDRVKEEFSLAKGKLGDIPAPFRDAILDPDAQPSIEAAQEAIRTLKSTFEDHVLPMLGG